MTIKSIFVLKFSEEKLTTEMSAHIDSWDRSKLKTLHEKYIINNPKPFLNVEDKSSMCIVRNNLFFYFIKSEKHKKIFLFISTKRIEKDGERGKNNFFRSIANAANENQLCELIKNPDLHISPSKATVKITIPTSYGYGTTSLPTEKFSPLKQEEKSSRFESILAGVFGKNKKKKTEYRDLDQVEDPNKEVKKQGPLPRQFY